LYFSFESVKRGETKMAQLADVRLAPDDDESVARRRRTFWSLAFSADWNAVMASDCCLAVPLTTAVGMP